MRAGYQVIVIAKEPRPGFAKTRLSPPMTEEGASRVAEAALEDTLAAVGESAAKRRLVALDGTPGDWLPPDFEVIPQRGAGLAERLSGAFADAFANCDLPAVLIGMDTPQVAPAQLDHAGEALVSACDAVIGPAEDGGYWLVGLNWLHSDAFYGIPMSTVEAGSRQVAQLLSCGYEVEMLETLRDVDTAGDAIEVAAEIPDSNFARAVGSALARASVDQA